MVDTDAMYDQFLREFEAFLRARSKKRRPRMQPLVWFERSLDRVLKASLAVADSFVTAITR
jgi:hypothetical protein